MIKSPGGSGSGGSATPPGGADHEVQYNNAGAFGGIAVGTTGQVLTSGGAGVTPAFAAAPASTPAGANKSIQFNNAGALGGISPSTAGFVLTDGGAGVTPTFAAPLVAGFANPSQLVGLSVVAGSNTTAMASDAAPALSQAIGPTWTGNHTFTHPTPITIFNAEPRLLLSETGLGIDEGLWDVDVNAKVFTVRTRNDADSAGVNVVAATRGATTALASIAFGNATNNPAYSFLGTGATVFGGNIQVTSTEPRMLFNESDQAADEKIWDEDVSAKVYTLRTRTDADGAGVNAIAVTRGTGTAISNIAFGNATNNPTYSFLGTSVTTFSGQVTSTRFNATGSSAPSNGIYANAANTLGIAANATLVASFNSTTGVNVVIGPMTVTTAEPRYVFNESDQAADLKVWDFDVSAAVLTGRTRTDADGAGKNWLAVTRGATTAIAGLTVGNATDNPTFGFLGTGIVTGAGVFQGPGGSAGTPTWSFSGDPNTGIYSSGADTIGFAANGTRSFEVGVNQANLTGGSAATPSLSFIGDPNTGLYNVSADAIGVALGGAAAVSINGATTTGAQTATFIATNKPGSGTAAPIAWLPVLTGGGTQGYIPIFGA